VIFNHLQHVLLRYKLERRLVAALLCTLLSLASLSGTKCHLRTDRTVWERPTVDSKGTVCVLVYWWLIIDHLLICLASFGGRVVVLKTRLHFEKRGSEGHSLRAITRGYDLNIWQVSRVTVYETNMFNAKAPNVTDYEVTDG
jgi:hypothetical protein